MNGTHSLFDHCADELASALAHAPNDRAAVAAILARYERSYPFRVPVALAAECVVGIACFAPTPPRGEELRSLLDTLFHGARRGGTPLSR